MPVRLRHPVLATLLTALAPVVAATVPLCGPAEARGEPWPGHPDRRLVHHVVRSGDTATGLAVRYHAWTRELVALNHLGRHATLRVGERIRIPVVVSAAARDRGAADRERKRAPRSRPAERAPHAQRTTHRTTQRATGPRWRHAGMSRAQVRAAIAREAGRHGVPVRLAQAVAWQESGWRQPVRSSAGALGVMQVLPTTGTWMSLYAHRPLDLRDTHDNITAGVTLLRVLLDETRSTRRAIGAYYQGLGAVRRHGLYPSTKAYVANVQAIRDRL